MISLNVIENQFYEVCVGEVVVYFSYKTPVAFRHPKVDAGRLVVCENVWSKTTARHLNKLDGGRTSERLAKANFDVLVKKHLEAIGVPKKRS